MLDLNPLPEGLKYRRFPSRCDLSSLRTACAKAVNNASLFIRYRTIAISIAGGVGSSTRMAKAIKCHKVYKFRMEPTELQGFDLIARLPLASSVTGRLSGVKSIISTEHYKHHKRGKPWNELSAELTRLEKTEPWLYAATGPSRCAACESSRGNVKSNGSPKRY